MKKIIKDKDKSNIISDIVQSTKSSVDIILADGREIRISISSLGDGDKIIVRYRIFDWNWQDCDFKIFTELERYR